MNQLIEKKWLIFIVCFFIIGCASTVVPKYNPQEFKTSNYQKNVDNAVDATYLLSNFDQNKVPAAELSTTDISKLVQADLYYNQGDYFSAYPLYSQLAYKYKDPRIVYKAINSLEHIKNTNLQTEQLNSLIDLFIKIDPDSNLSKLFQIKNSLNINNAKQAKLDLNYLMSNNESNGRVIFLYISSILSNDVNPNSRVTISEFSDYATSKYISYPEAHLCAMIGYAVADNQEGLLKQINFIHKYYPNWYVPIYWSSDVLVRYNHIDTLVNVLEPLVNTVDPDKTLQNIYVAALVSSKQTQLAKSYLLTQINSVNHDNVLLDLGIIAARENNIELALKYFNQTNITDKTLRDIVMLVKASMYDNLNQSKLAIINYEQVKGNPYLLSIAIIMVLNNYLNDNNLVAVDKILNRLTVDANMNEEQAILFKSSFYMFASRYQIAYDILDSRWPKYSKNQDYCYQYASLSSMVGKTKQAIILFKKYIRNNPKIAYGYNNLAYIYAQQVPDNKLARKYAEEAYKISPTDPNVLDTLGWVYYKSGDYYHALPYIKTSYDMKYDPDSAKHLIAVYNAINRPDLAKTVVVINQAKLQQEMKRELMQRSLRLLVYIQLGISVK